jgi:hypothetical protein
VKFYDITETHKGQVFILRSPENSVKNEDLILLSASFYFNGREMSCTPDLGKITTALFAVFSILVLIDYGSFYCSVLFIVVILPDQGGKRSEAATKGSGASSIELFDPPVGAKRKSRLHGAARTHKGASSRACSEPHITYT